MRPYFRARKRELVSLGGEGSGEEKIPQGGCCQQVRKITGEAGVKTFQKKSYGVVIDCRETQGVGEDSSEDFEEKPGEDSFIQKKLESSSLIKM